jgi:hypothetical protein
LKNQKNPSLCNAFSRLLQFPLSFHLHFLVLFKYLLCSIFTPIAFEIILIDTPEELLSSLSQVYTGSGTGSTGSSGTPSPSFFPVKPPKLGQGIKVR